jgi:hypothetical protein
MNLKSPERSSTRQYPSFLSKSSFVGKAHTRLDAVKGAKRCTEGDRV